MKIVRKLPVLVSFLVSFLCGAAVVVARDLHVPTAEFATIQRALDSARAGDTVIVAPGEYTLAEPLDFNRLHDPEDPRSPPLKNVTLRSGAGPESTFLLAESTDTGPLIRFEKGEERETVLEGFTLTGSGFGEVLSVRVSASSPTLRDCTFDARESNTAAARSAVACFDASPRIEACTFRLDVARGVSVAGGEAEVVRSLFRDGVSFEGGALLARDGARLDVRDCEFAGNRAGYGGALAALGGEVRVERSVFRGDRADHQGGAVFVSEGGSVELIECELSDNLASRHGGAGGGLCVAPGARAVVVSTAIVDNHAEAGGGLCVAGTLSISDSLIRRNHAGREGGGVFLVFGEVEGERVTLADNTAGRGGALSAAGGQARLERVTVTRNRAVEDAGALHATTGADVALDSSIVWGNGPRALSADDASRIAATFSDVETEADVLAGEGNILADPRFCAFSAGELTVTSETLVPEVLEFRTALAHDSPCAGTGRGGVTMGAAAAGCGEAGALALRVAFSAGEHAVGTLRVPDGVTFSTRSAAGEERARIDGRLTLEGTSRLERVHVLGGVTTSPGSRIEIEACALEGTISLALELESGSAALVVDSTIADSGSAVHCDPGSRGRFVGCAIRDNLGTGLSVHDAEAELTRCVIARNGGSACFVRGPSARLTLDRCVIESNRTTEIASFAAGVTAREGSRVVVSRSRISGNAARDVAALLLAGASAHLTDCLLSGNFSGIAATIEVYAHDDFRDPGLALVHCTLAGNRAGEGRNVLISAREAELLVRNSIIRDNDAQVAVLAHGGGTVDYSCLDADVVVPAARDNLLADPRFVRPGLFDFSGALATVVRDGPMPDFVVDAGDYRLAEGSPARDAGTPDGSSPLDHDLHARPCGPGVDMGAYEAGDCEPARFRRGDADGDGRPSITDALAIAQVVAGERPAPCDDATDANDDGTINLTDALYLLNHLFLNGPVPPAPANDCGIDPTPDLLGCETHADC